MSEVNQEVQEQEQEFNVGDLTSAQRKEMMLHAMDIVVATRPMDENDIKVQAVAQKLRNHLALGHPDDIEFTEEEFNIINVIIDSFISSGEKLAMQSNEMFAFAEVLDHQFNGELEEDLIPVHPPMETL